MTAHRTSPAPVRPVLAVPLLLAALAAVLVTAFAWPALRSAPRDVPVAVVGSVQAAAAVAQAQPGALDVHRVDTVEQARAAVREREAYGAVVLDGPQAPRVLVAGAASPAVSAALAALAPRLAPGTTVPVEDVVPLPAGDPRGTALAAGALPLVLTGVLTALLTGLLVAAPLRRAGVVLLTAPLAGLAVTGVLQGWLDALDGSLVVNAGVVALGVAAVGLALAGLDALGGRPAFGLGAATTVLLGNPLSGAASAPELLPGGWGTLGQLLPPGATVSLLRSAASFDGAGSGRPLVVLLAWAGLGLVLLVVAAGRRPAVPAAPVPA